jgi:CRISPR-associated protein Csc1
MAIHIYQGQITLMEHTYFASREVGILYESEPLIGNYALTYALGWCAAPYNWSGPPRYQQDLAPLNARGWYITPATFRPGKLRYVFSQFNAQSDSYYFRFDQNAIATTAKKARAANFPQAGKIRMLGAESVADLYVIAQSDEVPPLRSYIRLGKFNSKARIEWVKLRLNSSQPQQETREIALFLNAVDLPPEAVQNLRSFSVYNLYPAPLLRQAHLQTTFWHASDGKGHITWLPAGMRYGVEML